MAGTILMDAGGVLFNNVTEETDFLDRLAARYGADLDQLHFELDARDAAYETGRAHVHDVLRMALVAAGAPVHLRVDSDWLDDLYRDSVVARPGAFAAIADLRKYRPDLCLVLANNEAAHWDAVKDRVHGHLGRFDVVASSWQVGQVKPTPAFFTAVAERCGRPLEDAVLIDDNPEVIGAAERLGLGVLLADSPAALSSGVARLLEAGSERR
ncbi:HAD family hydrolase [Streptomyces sp. SP17KL33]|uniref:HAD family hydrolase n=1 Tax=Streptomyces sp. SP17KL33 TaxID=3002534 RepID=UPI002E7AA4AB|nr:HAD-IA family hydrolase [Streptomyces sp. SP17KL33]MEE1831700.1 HAD-IA family hydrolase [Streptomyces sp. SP17KL33]